MKIVFTTSGHTLDAPLDARFGRAAWFLVYDQERESVEMIDNRKSIDLAKGAGVHAAQTVVDTGARAVVTGRCGPKALRVLKAAGVQVFTTDAGTAAEALERYQAGQLVEMA
jgi:predicted Fe-Mo cluster-binding NifX family protein